MTSCNSCYSIQISMTSNEFIMDLLVDIPIQCGVYDQGFWNNYQLDMHILTHAREKPFQCTHCDKAWSRENYLEWHMLIHTGENTYKCTMCNQLHYTLNYLQSHISQHSEINQIIAMFVESHFHKIDIWKHIWQCRLEKNHIKTWKNWSHVRN